MQALREFTDSQKDRHARIRAGRYLQALALAKGDPVSAAEVARARPEWTDSALLARALLASVDPISTENYPGSYVPVGDAFISALRDFSVPRQLSGLRRAPMLTRIFINASSGVAAEVAEGAAIPALQGDWSVTTLTPRRFAGIVVQTDELVRSTSAVAAIAISDDVAGIVAEAENRAFLDPELAGSVLFGAPSFAASGSTVANICSDLHDLLDSVPAWKPGAAFVTAPGTSNFLSTVLDASGSRAFPDVSPAGGLLLGLPLIVSNAAQQFGSPPTRIVALIAPSQIFFSEDSRAILGASQQASLKMDTAADATAGNLVSMWQANATATKAVLYSSWVARSGAAAYFVAGY